MSGYVPGNSLLFFRTSFRQAILSERDIISRIDSYLNISSIEYTSRITKNVTWMVAGWVVK